MGNNLKTWIKDWGTLICVVLMVVMLSIGAYIVWSNSQNLEKTKTAACHAMQLSDDALVSFLNKQIAVTKKPSNPVATQAFMANLQQSYDEAQIVCLQGK